MLTAGSLKINAKRLTGLLVRVHHADQRLFLPLYVVEDKMISQHIQAWLLPGILGILAMIGLILLYSELRRAARLRKSKHPPLGFPDRSDRRKAS